MFWRLVKYVKNAFLDTPSLLFFCTMSANPSHHIKPHSSLLASGQRCVFRFGKKTSFHDPMCCGCILIGWYMWKLQTVWHLFDRLAQTSDSLKWYLCKECSISLRLPPSNEQIKTHDDFKSFLKNYVQTKYTVWFRNEKREKKPAMLFLCMTQPSLSTLVVNKSFDIQCVFVCVRTSVFKDLYKLLGMWSDVWTSALTVPICLPFSLCPCLSITESVCCASSILKLLMNRDSPLNA